MDIKNITKPYQNAIGEAIAKKGLPCLRLINTTTIFQVGLGYKQKRFMYDDINTAVATKICNNKNFTKYFLTQCGAPVPKGQRVNNKEELKKAFENLQKPVVVKPISEMWGKGVSTNLETWEETLKAYEIASQFKGDYVIIEEFIEGDDNRVLILNNEFIAGLKRTPPCVTGNGEDSIKKLIEKENEKRKDSKKIIKEIIVDDTVVNHLKKMELSLDSVLEKGKKTKIRMTGNICSGGISENITEKVHPSIVKLCKEIVSYLDLEIGGVDVITKDISKPLEETGGKISEVNQNPDITMHTSPYIGEPVDTAGIFIDYLFSSPEEAWIEITYKEKALREQKELNKLLEKIPQKVVTFKKKGSNEKIKINNPDKPLLNYLLSNLTFSVQL